MSIEETSAQPIRPIADSSSTDAPPAETLAGAGRVVRLSEDRSWRGKLRRFNNQFFRGRPLNVLGVAIIIVFIIMTAFGEQLVMLRGDMYDPTKPNIADKLTGPSWEHWFGTDDLGRDVFARTVSGAKYSLAIAFVILIIAVTSGTLIGAVAGYFGGMIDELLMRLTDMFLAFPALILAIAIAASLGPSLRNTVIALSVVYWPWYARLVRAQVLSIKTREYVEAARAIGAPGSKILLRHIMPNAVSVVIIQMTLDVGYAVLATSGLSFIGLGAQPPTPEWGRLITDGRQFFRDSWWFITFPGLALTLTVLGFNLVGDGLRDYLDPRTRKA
ncbi:MAG TPA: nickel transporter permease [Thermomicrobiales bacterium]|nr:nickel transporter permease [Thermomicrobiales bacterium]